MHIAAHNNAPDVSRGRALRPDSARSIVTPHVRAGAVDLVASETCSKQAGVTADTCRSVAYWLRQPLVRLRRRAGVG